MLVSCPRNNIYFAGSQLAVFQGANERPYLNHTGRESNVEKRPTGSGQKGCDENGPATALLVGHIPHHFGTGGRKPIGQKRKMVRDAPLLAPGRRPILFATKYMLFRGQDTRLEDEMPALLGSNNFSAASQALQESIEVRLADDASIQVVDLDALIRLKNAACRARDLEAVAELLRIKEERKRISSVKPGQLSAAPHANQFVELLFRHHTKTCDAAHEELHQSSRPDFAARKVIN